MKLLSIGSGVCSHELKLAEYDNFEEIVCVDLAQNRLNEAKEVALSKGLKNMHFYMCCKDREFWSTQTVSNRMSTY